MPTNAGDRPKLTLAPGTWLGRLLAGDIRRLAGARVEMKEAELPSASPFSALPPAPPSWIELTLPDGRIFHGLAAWAELAAEAGHPGLRYFILRFPLAARMLDNGLEWAAGGWTGPSESTAPPPPRPTYALGTWYALRIFGLAFFAAFLSSYLQVDALVGSRGLLPVADWAAPSKGSPPLFVQAPTLLLFAPTDAALHATCLIGMAAALLLAFDLLPALAAAVVWIAYLSLFHAGSAFWLTQFDAAILETSLLAALTAPWRWRGGTADPPAAARWLGWWLLFRLIWIPAVYSMLLDPMVRNLEGVAPGYLGQPLPTPGGYWASAAPIILQQAVQAAGLAISLAAPVLILLGCSRRMRALGGAGVIVLALHSLLMGNSFVMPWLLLALALTAFPDPPASENPRPDRRLSAAPAFQRIAVIPPVACIVALSLLQLPWLARPLAPDLPGHLKTISQFLRPFRLATPFAGIGLPPPRRQLEIVLSGPDASTPAETPVNPEYQPVPTWHAPHLPRLAWLLHHSFQVVQEAWLRAYLRESINRYAARHRLDPHRVRADLRLISVEPTYAFSGPPWKRVGLRSLATASLRPDGNVQIITAPPPD